jgi:hypothetical protein
MKNKTNKSANGVSKDNFIEFLANATPEEVNRYILEKGKPRKLVEPMIFFKDRNQKRSNDE